MNNLADLANTNPSLPAVGVAGLSASGRRCTVVLRGPDALPKTNPMSKTRPSHGGSEIRHLADGPKRPTQNKIFQILPTLPALFQTLRPNFCNFHTIFCKFSNFQTLFQTREPRFYPKNEPPRSAAKIRRRSDGPFLAQNRRCPRSRQVQKVHF